MPARRWQRAAQQTSAPTPCSILRIERDRKRDRTRGLTWPDHFVNGNATERRFILRRAVALQEIENGAHIEADAPTDHAAPSRRNSCFGT